MRGRGGRQSSASRDAPRARGTPQTGKRVGFEPSNRRRSSADPRSTIQWTAGRTVQPWTSGNDSDHGADGKEEDPDDDPDDEGGHTTDGDEAAWNCKR